jgi:hypothetical protein
VKVHPSPSSEDRDFFHNVYEKESPPDRARPLELSALANDDGWREGTQGKN